MSGRLTGAPDPAIWRREREQRQELKKERDVDLARHRADAQGDRRVFRTHAKVFLAYIRLARSNRPRMITVTALCKQSRISEAAFHKNFKLGVHGLLLATMEQISINCRKAIHREVCELEQKSGDVLTTAQRVTVAVSIFVRCMMRYPHLFNVEGILPREVMYLASDVLVDAIIWDEAASPTRRAEVGAIAKYHATALIGIMRSGLGGGIEHNKLVARVIYTMISQILPALSEERYPDEEQFRFAEKLKDPLMLRVSETKAYRKLARKRFS